MGNRPYRFFPTAQIDFAGIIIKIYTLEPLFPAQFQDKLQTSSNPLSKGAFSPGSARTVFILIIFADS
jgi:hypothetical protein